MNADTKTLLEKATPRPWKLDSERLDEIVRNCQLIATVNIKHHHNARGVKINDEQGMSNAALIVRAVNEYEALCAVAEAAKELKAWLDSKSNNPTVWPEPPVLWNFNRALAAFAALRKAQS